MLNRLLAAFLLVLVTAPAMARTLADETIYMIMIDRFADGNPDNNQDVNRANPLAFQGGDLIGIRENLDEIASLGATAIWITPVALQIDGFQDNKGRDFYPHHGYWAKDLTKLDPRFGTEADLKALVDAAHARGIKVILDVVYNHLGYGMENDPVLGKWLRKGDECGGTPETKCLAGLPDFKTELPEVRRYLFDAQIGLAERTGLDGFRLDTVKHISHDFWQAHRAEVKARLGEDFMLIGEVWDADRFTAKRYFKNDEIDALFDFSFRDRTQKFLSGVYDAAKFGRYLTKRHDVRDGYYLAPFLSNHDMSMMLAMLGGNVQKLKIGAAVLLTIEGPPVIVWGEEVGRRGSAWPDNREVMAWGARDIQPGAGIARNEDLRGFFRDMIAFRNAHPSTRGAEFTVLYSDKDVLVYRRGDDVIVAINRSDTRRTFTIDGLGDGWTLAVSSVGDTGGTPTDLPPLSAGVFAR